MKWLLHDDARDVLDVPAQLSLVRPDASPDLTDLRNHIGKCHGLEVRDGKIWCDVVLLPPWMDYVGRLRLVSRVENHTLVSATVSLG